MAADLNECQMEEDFSGVEIRMIENKGNALFAVRDFQPGDTIFQELPLVFCQYPWNRACGYKACDHCIKSLETVEENVKRLLKREEVIIPHPECCVTNKITFTQCEFCGVEYCSPQCKEAAWVQYHQTLCTQTNIIDGKHPLEQINETWKHMNYPPETSSIMIFARILSMIQQANDKNALLHQFSQFHHHATNEDLHIAHKLLGQNFTEKIELLREMLSAIFTTPETQPFLTPDGFRSLIALVGTNGQGVGSSPLAIWAGNVEHLELTPIENKEIEIFIDKLYEEIEEETGGFLNCEGSALYTLQSKCNHSCIPNAEISFIHGDTRLTLRALKPIKDGEEITICYLDPCILTRSRHSRRKLLRANYIFECQCVRCEKESTEQEDVTSDDEPFETDDD